AAIVARLSGDPTAREAAVYVVDSRRGCEMGADLRALVETCVRRHVPEIRFGTEGFRLTDEGIRQLELQSTIRPSPSVHKIKLSKDSAAVEFKRFTPETHIRDQFRLFNAAAEEQHTLNSVCAGLVNGAKPADVLEEAHRLQTAGILSLELGE